MKRLGQILWGLVALLLLTSPYLGLTFGLTFIITGISSYFYPSALPYFFLNLKIYGCLATFTFFILITWGYQNCCVGLGTFREHLKHDCGKILTEYLFGATVWPYCWYIMNRNFSSWGKPWGQIVADAFYYWLVTTRKGTEVTYTTFPAIREAELEKQERTTQNDPSGK